MELNLDALQVLPEEAETEVRCGADDYTCGITNCRRYFSTL